MDIQVSMLAPAMKPLVSKLMRMNFPYKVVAGVACRVHRNHRHLSSTLNTQLNSLQLTFIYYAVAIEANVRTRENKRQKGLLAYKARRVVVLHRFGVAERLEDRVGLQELILELSLQTRATDRGTWR